MLKLVWVPFVFMFSVLSLNSAELPESFQLESGCKKKVLHHKFSSGEDVVIRDFVNEYGNNWKLLVGSILPNLTIRQVRDRYLNYLSPNVNLSKWTEDEEQLLMSLHAELGNKWVKITRFFPNRTDSNIKNHWSVLQRREAKQIRIANKKTEKDPVIVLPQNPVHKVSDEPSTLSDTELFPVFSYEETFPEVLDF